MSFSKARIQRFNELSSEAPPPGSYDPKFDHKVKGITIEKKERFQDSKSVTSSGGECNSSVSSKGAGALPSPKFRTPQLPKKRPAKPTNVSCPKAKTKLVLGTSKELKYDVRHELADLKVECVNKDRTILDHANQIEEMKKETWRLEKELTELRAKEPETKKLEIELAELCAKQEENEEQHKKDLETMAKLQNDILDCRDQKHTRELEILHLQLSKITATREHEISSQKAAEEIIEMRFAKIREHSSLLEENIKRMELDARSEIERLTSKLAQVKSTKEREIEDLSSIVSDKENELSAVRTECQQLKIVSDELRDQLTRLENDREAEIVLLKNKDDCLRAEIVELQRDKDELNSKLDIRQRFVMELQSQLSTVQCEMDELKAEHERASNDCEIRIRDNLNNRESELTEARQNFIRERERLESEKLDEITRRLELERVNKELRENNAFFTEELQDVQKLYKDASRSLKEVREELAASDVKHAETLKKQQQDTETMRINCMSENSRLEKLLENSRLEYIRELDNMAEARNNELADVKSATERTIDEEKRRINERTEKIVLNAEAVTRETLAACRAESEERVKRVIAETDAKVKSMAIDARKTVEEEMREAAERYATCLARVEAERLVLEKKVDQRDAEIVKLSDALEELKVVVENQESFSQSLQDDLDRVEAELSERKDEIRGLKDQMRSEAAQMVARRRRFEVVMAENQASVGALSQRLSESNAEVERLQSEIKIAEESINEHRSLLVAMRNTSNILTKKVYTLMEQLDANKGIVDQLEAVNLAEIESVRSHVYSEIENFRLISTNEMKRLRDDNKSKDEKNAELKKHLDAMAVKVDEAHEFLLKMEELEDTRVIEISQLSLDNERLARELKSTRESKAALEAESKLAVKLADQKIFELNATIEALKSDNIVKEKVKIMREQHETRLNEEILRRQASEEEVKKLSEDCDNLRKSYQEVTEKYAEMIGHHNQKQRVKHLNQLKDKIIRLEKDAETKKHVIDQQTRTIEKLKAEEKRSYAKGKENLHSHGILRSPYTTPASSPLKPLTPLRDRNE